jgi:hypothetical protein
MSEPQKVAEFVVPDADYIRRDVPMSEVAEKLGLDVRDRWVRCHNDRSHWARIWLRKNMIKCFRCASRPMTTIDLVMNMLEMDVRQAINWIAERFDVHMRRKRITRNLWGITRHLYTDYPPLKRPRRLELSIDVLRRAPLWGELTPTARRLAAFLIEAVPRDSLVLSVTYRELQRSLQTANRGTLKRAFAQLCEIGLIETQREASENEGFVFYASKTLVRLTWGSESFQSSLAPGASATKYIGSKLNHESDKEMNHAEEYKTVKKVNHGPGPEKVAASPQELCGDLASFTPCIGIGVHYAAQDYNFEAIRLELGGIFGIYEGERDHAHAGGQQSLVPFSGVPEKRPYAGASGEL